MDCIWFFVVIHDLFWHSNNKVYMARHALWAAVATWFYYLTMSSVLPFYTLCCISFMRRSFFISDVACSCLILLCCENLLTHLTRKSTFCWCILRVLKTAPDPRMLCHTEGKFTTQKRTSIPKKRNIDDSSQKLLCYEEKAHYPSGKVQKNTINTSAMLILKIFAKAWRRVLISGIMSGETKFY